MSDEVQQIKDKIDVADLVGEYVQLKPAGVNRKGLCPFHHEKTPSFMVSPERKSWHCFGCFPKGALIQTNVGFKNIEDIKKDDLVYTHKGRLQKVVMSLIRDYSGMLREVHVRKSSLPIKLTGDHEVFAIKTAHCIQKSRDTRLCQKRCKQNCPHKYFGNYKMEKIPASSLKAGDYLFYPINRVNNDIKKIKLTDYLNREFKRYCPTISALPKYINIDEMFLKLIGYWIAEGSNHRAYIRFSLGGHELSFAEDIVNLCRKIFGIEAKIYKAGSGKSGFEVTCCNSNLANIFENLCGKGAACKHIPFGWESLPFFKQRILLEAIFRGDGHTSKGGKKSRYGYRSVSTISHLLVFQMRNILLRQRIIPSIHHKKERIDKKGTKHRQSYNIFWFESPQANYADWWKVGRILYAIYPIKKIIEHEFRGEVFNLTVRNDHSYVTENFAVGNCGKGGDIFTFIEEIEGMEFKEALKYLANKAGVVLSNNFKQEIGGSQRNRLKDINTEATRFFYNFLIKIPSAKLAMDYLIKRGIKPETIDEWQIGFIPEQWDLLTQYLLKKGFAIDDLVASGLTIKRDNADPKTYRGFYDRFRGRIMFPIWDAHGDVVGFTGRVLVEKENSGGKYVNTPQTAVYDKSRVIFGLNKAKQEIRAKNLIVMVEGQMDVIACHQAGMKNVVASSGTALTEEHVKLLKRYSGNINMAFDMDEAGQNAARRGIAVALREGMNIKVIRLPAGAGKDPDECLKKHPQVWFEAVEKAQDVMEWYFDKAFTNKDPANHHHKQAISNELLPDIALIQYAVERDHWLRLLSEKLNVDVSVLREDMARISQKFIKSLPPRQAGIKLESPSGQIQTNEKTERTPLDMRIERLFGLVFKFPGLVEKVMNGGLDGVLSTGRLSPLYEQIKMQYNANRRIEPAELPPGLIDGAENAVDLLLMQGDWEFADFYIKEAGDELDKLIIIIKNEWKKKRHKELQIEIEKAEKAGEKNNLKQLLEEYNKVHA